jgi:hypothetical protein
MYVGALIPHPIRSIETRSLPNLVAGSLAALPSISLVPFAPLLKGWMFKPFRGYNNAN